MPKNKRIIMKDEDGKVTYDSELVQKQIKKVGRHVEFIKNNHGIQPVSRWGKEVVLLLKKNREMKNNDIIIALNKRGMTASYQHISQIFKSKSDREFYREGLLNNGSYFSLKSNE